MDPESFAQLLTPPGWALLDGLPPYDEGTAMHLGEALRAQGLDPGLVAAALTQSRLRARATSKFGEFASSMLFTPDGLEQATRLSVAVRHARRYLDAGLSYVADLGCGIGGDAMALAGLELRVLAVEADEMTAAIATVNLRQLPEAEVRHGDAFEADLSGVDGIWADPARRTSAGARLRDLRSYSPSVERLLALRESVPALGLKLGPAIAHGDVPDDAHAQWVSVDGTVLEADLWFGPLAPEGPGRSALVVTGDDAAVLAQEGTPSSPVVTAPSGPVAEYLYEPDGAVIRAGLVADLARDLDGHLLDPRIAYVTTSLAHPTPFAHGFRVLDEFAFSLKRLRAYLRERDVGTLEIKKRGTAVVPEQLRSQLQLRGRASATVALTRIGGAPRVLVLERLGRDG
ncbi:conserved hypothetical protein [Beutenbergia cavernae DSM 12333]|uniref:THUMP-like domain-containing protein n=1 Tax=Beutenbergia cavernae (strain ATCC BAA-8 / DSM 12333 / CCUG 43141 / JCM 11478 / NBRC 16432 / NCIMB 13614 / HKI 0122) TaxID=471853 RepID=C5BZX4_BEUC1|nr:class I SAM-dependent methyltransferase [Beutenbergia cavernae]ACQ81304.1 conserved hypothetical protein [Beutenbergia cavernae DSM 12333]